MDNIDAPNLESARRRIAADVLELRSLKLRFRTLLRSLEEGYGELSEAIGLVIPRPEPEIP